MSGRLKGSAERRIVVESMAPTKYLLLASIVGTVLYVSAGDLMAQTDQTRTGQRQGGGRQRQGNFDPAQFRQRMMDRFRERLEITDDSEWKAIQLLIQNVMDARAAMGAGGRGRVGRGGRRGEQVNAGAQPSRPDRPPGNPAAEELQKAIDAKAPSADMKAALAKYAEYRKGKQAELDKARDALRAVLTSRQEAIATLSGLL